MRWVSWSTGCFISTWTWDRQEDTLCYKYIAAYLLDEKPFLFFFPPTQSKAEAALLFGFSSSVSVPLVIVRTVSQRRSSAQQEKAPVQYFQSLLSLWLTGKLPKKFSILWCGRTNTQGPVEVWEISEKNMNNVIQSWHLSSHFIYRRPAVMTYV